VLSVLLMGLALNSLGIFLHEGLHGLLARNERLNHLLSFLVGFPILISATAYQTTHNDHHYDLGRKLDYGTYRQHLDKPALVWFAYWLQLTIGSVIYVLFIPLLALKSGSGRTRAIILLEYVLMGAGYAWILHKLPVSGLLLYWVYPLIVLNLLSNIRGLASHALGDVEDIYLSSRTISCSKLSALLFLHENYHLEHHLFPRVPSYHLAELHRLIRPRLPRALAAPSYPAFLRLFFRSALNRDLQPQGVEYPQGNPKS
jgi:fatty acid desaturase